MQIQNIPYPRSSRPKRHTPDPGLNIITHKLNEVTWHTELDPQEVAVCDEREKGSDFAAGARHHVVMLPDFRTWAVRLYLGGGQRTLGLCTKADAFSTALRFADMARMYFWKYRVRCAHEPTDGELNLSVLRCRADLLAETDAVSLLHEIEEYLLGTGALTTASDKEHQRQETLERRSRSHTVSGALIELSDTWRTVLREHGEAHDARLASMEKEINRQASEIARVNRLLSLSDLLLAVRPVTYGLHSPPETRIVQPREIPTKDPAVVPGFVTFIGDPAEPVTH